MGKGSKIDWIENTWNPWVGCHETTNPGCKECYAIHRFLPRQGIQPGQLRRTGEATWRNPLKWQDKCEKEGRIESVFMSLCDFFHSGGDRWRDDAWKIIRETPNLQWVILTQRISNVPSRLPDDWGAGYPNVWLGVSASDQQHADERIPKLLAIPAAKHVISLEPMREKIILRDDWLCTTTRFAKTQLCEPPAEGKAVPLIQKTENCLAWVIAGGASGDNWRSWPLYPNWIRSLRDQCQDIPFFFKQLGGPEHDYRNGNKALLDGKLYHEIPESTCIIANQSKLL